MTIKEYIFIFPQLGTNTITIQLWEEHSSLSYSRIGNKLFKSSLSKTWMQKNWDDPLLWKRDNDHFVESSLYILLIALHYKMKGNEDLCLGLRGGKTWAHGLNIGSLNFPCPWDIFLLNRPYWLSFYQACWGKTFLVLGLTIFIKREHCQFWFYYKI
jgi:hypothetical protein